MLRGQDIVCLSSIDWQFIWQGHQEIMSALAANGNRVLFVENTGVRSAQLRDVGRLQSRLRNWRRGVNGFRRERRDAPPGRSVAPADWKPDPGAGAEHPVIRVSTVELDVEVEHLAAIGVDVCREAEPPTGPRRGAVGILVVVAVQQPTVGQKLEDGVLIVVEDREVDVAVVTGATPEPRVDGPAAAQRPLGFEIGHQRADARQQIRDWLQEMAPRSKN